MILAVDLLSTFLFAIYGSSIGARYQSPIIIIGMAATVTAVGGGTLRQMLLGGDYFWLNNQLYLLSILAAVVYYDVFGYKHNLDNKLFQHLHSFAVAAFIVIGCIASFNAGMSPTVTVLLSMLTAIGGGLIRDLILRRKTVLITNPGYLVVTALNAATISFAFVSFGNFFLLLITAFLLQLLVPMLWQLKPLRLM